LLDFLPYEERNLQKTGVQFFGFGYSSPQLRGHHIRKKTKLRVKYDPRDISRVWVQVSPGNLLRHDGVRSLSAVFQRRAGAQGFPGGLHNGIWAGVCG